MKKNTEFEVGKQLKCMRDLYKDVCEELNLDSTLELEKINTKIEQFPFKDKIGEIHDTLRTLIQSLPEGKQEEFHIRAKNCNPKNH